MVGGGEGEGTEGGKERDARRGKEGCKGEREWEEGREGERAREMEMRVQA